MLYPLLQVDCTEMCVGSACTQPSYNDKNPSSVFFNLLICFPPSQIELSSCDVTRSEAPPTIV